MAPDLRADHPARAGGVVRVRGEVVGIDSAPPGDDPGEADVVVVGGTAYLRLRGRSPISADVATRAPRCRVVSRQGPAQPAQVPV